MKSVKAILIGGGFIVISLLLIQLVYLFVVVGYNYLIREYGFEMGMSESIGSVIWGGVYLLVMFYGGYITAEYSESQALAHSALVGVLVTAIMVAMALQNTQLTLTGVVLAIASVAITVAGGIYSRSSEKPSNQSSSRTTGVSEP